MQSNGFAPQRTHSRAKKIIFWGKIVVLALVISYVVLALRRQEHDLKAVWRYWQTAEWLSVPALLLFVLTPVNWLLEALKWQILVRRVESITLGQAVQGVLAGLSLGFALPGQLGDTAGRILSLRSDRRWQSIGASLVSGGMQFYVALLFGTLALALLPPHPAWETTYWIVLSLLALLIGLGLLLGWQRHRLAEIQWPWLKKFEPYWAVAAHYTTAELVKAGGAAALRHLTFSGQFALALHLFGVQLPVRETASGIGLVYLGKTLVPAFNLLSDLGVREAASLWVFSQWNVPAPQVLSATLTLWFVNILTPVLVGLLWVWKLNAGTTN